MPNRSAKTGKYVTKAYAVKHPNTTVRETDKPKPKPPSGGKGKK